VVRLPTPTLTDGIVVLRPCDRRDLPGIDAGLRDADVVRWFGQPASSAEEVLELNARRWSDGSPTLAILDRDGAFAGLLWMNASSRDASLGSVGYWLLPIARGRGLATRAVRLLSTWTFRDLGVATLAIVAEAGNAASQRVAVRSGFRQIRTLPGNAVIDGRRVDQVLFELRAAGGSSTVTERRRETRPSGP
jgi:RimJ/RimL family protein N-acetyltransferase